VISGFGEEKCHFKSKMRSKIFKKVLKENHTPLQSCTLRLVIDQYLTEKAVQRKMISIGRDVRLKILSFLTFSLPYSSILFNFIPL